MTSMPDLNITGSPIYEDLVAASGDPYQPPAYQLPDVYGGGYVAAPPPPSPASTGSFTIPGAISMQAPPEAVTQWLSQFLGNGNWFAVLIFGGGAAEQIQRMYQPAQYTQPAPSGYDSWSQYSPEQVYQAYQWYAAQQAQAALEARTPAALPAAPEPYPAAAQYVQPQQPPTAMTMQMQMPYGAEATQQFGGMLTQDWADWLGRASQTTNPQMEEVGTAGYQEERRGGLGGRFGAALRELRGR